MEKITVSIHIPKTGGTSLGKMFLETFPGKTLLVYQHQKAGLFGVSRDTGTIEDEIRTGEAHRFDYIMYMAYRDGITHIHGNIPIEYLVPYFDRVRLVTFVREPKERTHSQYCHEKKNGYDGSDVWFYRKHGDDMFKYTHGQWHLFDFIGRFETFGEDIKKLGITHEIHVNKGDRKEDVSNPEWLERYTLVDQDIYSELNNMVK
tara:strand:- start:2849 stop:3460 length:612 start_codon:yes stop_codon:yes gene_type:complete